MIRRQLSLASAVTLALVASSFGHDLSPGAPGGAATWKPERLAYMPEDRASALSLPEHVRSALLYIVALPNRWSQGQALRVCFVGGGAQLRTRILQVAQIWIAHTNLSLSTGGPAGRDCTHDDTSEVRIGFSEPGYWSYVGNDSIAKDLIDHDLTSMNFEGFDQAVPAEPRFTGLVLHEWGHALALHHQHQSPAQGCDKEYDWPKLYTYYKSHYGWDNSMVDTNLRELQADRKVFDWGDDDPDSNMIYASDPQFLIHGKQSPCYFHDNNKLSAQDIVGIERTYPQGAALALQVQSVTLPVALNNPSIQGGVRQALQRQQLLVQQQLSGVQ